MEDSSEDFGQLSLELLKEFGGLGRRMSPGMRNAARGEIGVMRALDAADAPLTPTQIAERTHLSSARVANVLRSLEEKGSIAREHSREDRRRVTVSLTPAGQAEIARGKAEFEAQASAFLAQLGPEDTHEALRILRRVNQIIDQRRAAGTAVMPAPQNQEGGCLRENH